MQTMLRSAVVGLMFLFMNFTMDGNHAIGQEWTRFRGPNGSGLSEAKNVPVTWTEKDVNWRVKLPAGGHSSPVLWGDLIFLSGADDSSAERMVFAMNAKDGKLVWSRNYSSSIHKKHKLNSFASPTAACDKDFVYYSWSAPEELVLLAVTHDGKEKWKRNLGPFVSQHSAGVSPILYEDMVILVNCQDADGNGQSSVLAVNRSTGQTVWELPRESTTVPYSTPCFRKNAQGQDELILNHSSRGISAVDPTSGKVNWEIADLINKRSVSSPVITGNGLITISCGSGGGGNFLVAVHPKEGNAVESGAVAYKIDKTAPYVPTPLAKGDRLFLMADNGIAIWADAKTGKEIWKERIGGTFYSSPIWVGDSIYCTSADGEVVVLAANDKYEMLARNNLGEASHSSPAAAGGRLHFRTINHLFSIGGEKVKLASN